MGSHGHLLIFHIWQDVLIRPGSAFPIFYGNNNKKLGNWAGNPFLGPSHIRRIFFRLGCFVYFVYVVQRDSPCNNTYSHGVLVEGL